MIKALKALFEVPTQETPEERQHRLQLAAAALLIETARADFTQGAEEEAALATLLSSSLRCKNRRQKTTQEHNCRENSSS